MHTCVPRSLSPSLAPQVLLSGGAERHVRLADFGLSDLRSAADAAALSQSRVSTAVQTDTKRGTWCVRCTMRGRAPGPLARSSLSALLATLP